MKLSDKQDVIETLESEGFDYTFIHYSSFAQVKDEKFHELRENYKVAHKELADYLGFED